MNSDRIYKVVIYDKSIFSKYYLNDYYKNCILLKNFDHFIKQRLVFDNKDGTFRDLKTGELYKKEDIIEEFMVPIGRMFKIKKHILSGSAIKKYENYLKEPIDIFKLYIADICLNPALVLGKKEVNFIGKKDCLLTYENEIYTDLETLITYKSIVINPKPFIKYLYGDEKNTLDSRDKVLTKYRNKFKKQYIGRK